VGCGQESPATYGYELNGVPIPDILVHHLTTWVIERFGARVVADPFRLQTTRDMWA
jgi:hypothetical protein